MEERREAHQRELRLPLVPSLRAEALHFLGEIEVVFGLWVVVLLMAMLSFFGWETATHYLNEGVNYTEALFVVVIMALAATRPVVLLAESWMRRVAALGRETPGAWWLTILVIGPLLGSFITEPAAMTICALLLARQFYDLVPSTKLKYATLGLLFVNVSIGGTLTHFAAPPVLMVARPWSWDYVYMSTHFGWKAATAICVSCGLDYLAFRAEFRRLAQKPHQPDIDRSEDGVDEEPSVATLPAPMWVAAVHLLFIGWTVVNAHHPPLFIGGFLFFLGFARATRPYQSPIDLKPPLLVGFFLAGLVIHGGLQGWWIEPTLASLSVRPLYYGAMLLTAFNDNALVTYLATLVPSLTEPMNERGRHGGCDRRGLDGHCQCAEPGGPGDPQPLLRRERLAVWSPARRPGADGGRDAGVQVAVETHENVAQWAMALGWTCLVACRGPRSSFSLTRTSVASGDLRVRLRLPERPQERPHLGRECDRIASASGAGSHT